MKNILFKLFIFFTCFDCCMFRRFKNIERRTADRRNSRQNISCAVDIDSGGFDCFFHSVAYTAL